MTHFVHDPYIPGETIAAICTPPGEGGVAMVRISGDDALLVANAVFSGDVTTYDSHTVHYGLIHDAQGNRIDDVLLIVMHGPRTYTGEHTIEVCCHGGAIVTRRVLEVILEAGARAARPGEFTFKAYTNGKIDLAQAEAVQELIGAKNEHALDAAEQQLEGSLSERVNGFQRSLTGVAAILEAWVDFPEEGLEFASIDEVCEQLRQVQTAIETLVSSYHDGRIIHDGVSLALIGSPNVGKSSLMNALLDKERAIVSDIAGTTRDVVEDHLRLNGLNLKLIDTAGIREDADAIEAEGIRRSRAAMIDADLILVVLDASRSVSDDERRLLVELPSDKTIVVWNKIDIGSGERANVSLSASVELSAKERTGLDALHKAIDETIWDQGPPSRGEFVLTSQRHRAALVGAGEALQRLIAGLQDDVSPEFLNIEMRDTLSHLGQIIGTDIGEDVLSAIFSTFCVGK